MKIGIGLVLVAVLAWGCGITDYPVITDTRGDFTGVIRTGHSAYIIPSAHEATIWFDGSDELFSTVYQNQYGDQMIYTFNNYDPTASVLFLDDTYCDWRYDGCELMRAWNPVREGQPSDPFDYQGQYECSGFRSMEIILAMSSRTGECGDRLTMPRSQDLAAEIANLIVTSWRGQTEYLVPMDASNTSLTLTTPGGVSESMPIFGHYDLMLDDQLRLMVPMTPNARHQWRWLAEFAQRNGKQATATLQYGSFTTSMKIGLVQQNLEYAVNRF